jgi:hypothetical protein
MMPETLPVEGLFGLSMPLSDNRFQRATVTETMGGIQKGGLAGRERQQIAFRTLKTIVWGTRHGNLDQMPIRSFLNDYRRNVKSRRRAAYRVVRGMDPNALGLPTLNDFLAQPMDSVPTLPSLALLERDAAGRIAVRAPPAPPAPAAPMGVANDGDDGEDDSDDEREEDVNNPEAELDDRDDGQDNAQDNADQPRENAARGNADRMRLWREAFGLMQGRFLSGRLAAQPVPSRCSRKTNAQHGTAHQQAQGGRAQQKELRDFNADDQASRCT